MADSKFLKWQDKDGNGLIDVCDDVLDIPAADNCPSCLKNPAAITPDWLTRTKYEPFLNERTCEYQITLRTKHTTTIDETLLEEDAIKPITLDKSEEAVDERFEEYVNDAIQALLDYYEKDDSEASRLAILDVIDYTEYDLDPRPKSRLKLLYSVPFDDLNALDDAAEESDDEEDEGDEVEVTYEPADLEIKLIRVRKTLNLYNRYLKVYRALDGGNLYFLESNAIFNLEDYGDLGVFPKSILADLLPQLDAFLTQKGYDLPGVGNPFKAIGKDKVQKLEFKFSNKYKLKKLSIYTEDCKEKPIIFNKKLSILNSKSAWKDKTALAYLAQLDDMDTALQAREAPPWLEFVEKYTYPKIYSSVNAGYENTDPENSEGSCIAGALAAEGKQFGQDILDDVFSIGDAIAYRFHKNLCIDNLEELAKQEVDQGLRADWPNPRQHGANAKNTHEGIGAMATEQAFKEIFAEESPCLMAYPLMLMAYGIPVGDVWKFTFDPLKQCGLLDLLLEAVKCLFGGLSLEEALASMLKSALRSMSLEYFGDLFVGLPPDKQAELDALVQKKLESGELFSKSSKDLEYLPAGDEPGEESSDTPLIGKVSFVKPWEDEDAIEAEKKAAAATKEKPTDRTMATDYDSQRGTANSYQEADELEEEQVVTQAKQQLKPTVIMEAYILSLLELYADNLLGLTDLLNKFPGAQIIANIIAIFTCPTPAIRPNVMDFLHSIELPFCRDSAEIVLPRLFNPAEWMSLPRPLGLIWKALWNLIKLEIQKLILKILIKLMIKICELIGNAICKALETVGDLAAALPAMAAGRTTFSDVIRESICGEDTSEEQINDTIVDMISTLGVGGAALADTEQTLSFAEDISAATTRNELMSAFLGKPSNDFLTIVNEIVEFEYPDYQDSLGNKNKIGSLFKNMGNLMPVEFKDTMQNFVDTLPADDAIPANPTLCATPEALDNFKELRCELLSGRATKEQCDKMFDNLQDKSLGDLEQLGNVLQGGIPNYLADNMPPIISAPGCDDGLVPFESEEAAAATAGALGNNLEQLKMDFSYDMLGNGPGKNNWGFINMILSDTMGKPFTAHQRKKFNLSRRYVDFYVDMDADNDTDTGAEGAGSIDNVGKFARISKQKGAYPIQVAGWLETALQALAASGVSYSSNNDVKGDVTFRKSFDDFDISKFRGSPQNLLMIPDLGYNVGQSVDAESEEIVFTKFARKSTPDMTLSFDDNGDGRDLGYIYGFDLDLYLADMYESGSTYVNRFSDNVRVKLTSRLNTSVAPAQGDEYKTDDDEEESGTDENIIENREFEFLGVDDTLTELDLDSYTEFLASFNSQQSYSPPVILLTEILNQNGGSFSQADIKSAHDEIMSTVTTTFVEAISLNSASFSYGAEFDDLTPSDIEYVTKEGTPYFEVENIDDGDGGTRKIQNDDQIMGMSNMQYEEENNDGPPNRVLYLDPIQYGGSYMNPPLYIKPKQNKGWLGFIDVMFPEISPCKPSRTDIIDFEDIDDKIDQVYPNIPEDTRLLGDPDCVIEKPYNRILERPAAAGIQGLITAAIRIYVSVHFIKSLTTFTKFYPKFPETFSSLYASYIVEQMEKSFKDAQKSFWEFFNPFKDEEFWYAFLEQSVQLYARRVDDGDIENPSITALNACIALNNAQQNYDYPNKEDLKEEKEEGSVSFFKTLKNYRSENNLAAVQETDEYAKLILKELVMEQLVFMGEKFISNLEQVGMKPDIYDLDYFLLTDMTQGGIDLDLNKEIKEEVADLPDEEEDELYTQGGEFYVSEKLDDSSEYEQSDEYVGYFHAIKDDDGNLSYIAGEFDSEEAQDVLTPFASKVIVPIGDIEEYGYEPSTSAATPFVVEKYISIDGTKYDTSVALDIIKANDSALLMSEVYPGTLELVRDSKNNAVGVEGEMGVRYGLLFSIMISGEKVEVTTAEIDALDLSIGQTAPLEGDSKMLLCLINLLTKDNVFMLISRYIFPLPKITAMLAIYNDFAFLPSIAQNTVAKGDYKSSSIAEKPGQYVSDFEEDGTPILSPGAPGWANYVDRDKVSLFVLTWDEWDKQLLRNSNSRIKRLFKNYYNSRDFVPGEGDDDLKPGKIFLNELRERFKPAAGRQLLPWWKKRMLRTNPLNEAGELCEKD